jgi:multidrug efflux pump
VVDEELPEYAQIDYKGESREYQEAGGAVMLTFALALLIVYLVLAAQFESFIHPLVIMLTVPLAVLGALLGPVGHRQARSTCSARSASSCWSGWRPRTAS